MPKKENPPKHKKRAPPPPPAMFKLYAPVHAFGAAIESSAAADEVAEEADDSKAAPPLFQVEKTTGEGGEKNPKEKSEANSAVGGANDAIATSTVPSDADDPPPKDGARANKSASAIDRPFQKAVTTENEGGSYKVPADFHFSKADKCPRLGTVEEYARRTKEREDAASGKESGRGSAGKGGENVSEGGGVKTKSTPRLPNDLPPGSNPSNVVKMKNTPRIPNPSDLPPAAQLRGKQLRKPNRRGNEIPKATTAPLRSSRRNAGGGDDLKSPPEESVPNKTKARGKRSASVMADELISNLVNTDDAKSPDDTVEEGERGRSKRARIPSVAAMEAQNNEGFERALRAMRSIRSSVSPTKNDSKKTSSAEVTAATKRSAPEPKKRSAPVPKKSSGPKPSKSIPSSSSSSSTSSDSSTSSSSSSNSDSTAPSARTKKTNSPRPKATQKGGRKVKVAVVKKELTPVQIEYLEQKRAKTWNSRIAMLTEFKNKYNTCSFANAPAGSVSVQLRNFVGETRKQYRFYKSGDVSSMTPERIDELEKLGFDFAPTESEEGIKNRKIRYQKKWDDMFTQLEAYKAATGNCLVTSMTGTDNQTLGSWVRGQRKLMNKVGRDGFPPERLAKLESIGFDFDPVNSGTLFVHKKENSLPKVKATWEKHYKDFVNFKKIHGHIIVGPKSDGFGRLYDWLHIQRKNYKKFQAGEKCVMRPEWITKLEKMGFDWAPMSGKGFSKMLKERQKDHYEIVWHRRFQEIVAFKEEHGHCHPSRANGVKDSLAGWVHVQRKHKRRHDKGEDVPMTEERIKLLDSIGFDWNPGRGTMLHRGDKDNWEGQFQKLVAYKKKKGDCDPKKRGQHPQLGSWASRMRSLYKRNKRGETTSLTDERIAKLKSIDFDFE